MVLRRSLFFLILIILSSTVFGQSEFIFDHIGVDQGLSNPVVTSIHQDSKGFMWFGTFSGLNRYDGYEFKNYLHDTNDSLSISDTRITCIFEDSRKNLWVGTNMGGLNLYNRDQDNFTRFTNGSHSKFRISSNRVESIMEDSKGNLWVGTNDGLNLFDYQSFSFQSFYRDGADPTSLNSNQVYSLVEYDDEVWVLTNENQLNKYIERSKNFSRFSLDRNKSIPLPSARLSFRDADRNVWVGTFNDGLFKWNANGLRQYKHDPNNKRSLSHNLVKTILQDDHGTLWVGTDGGGLNIYNNAANDFTNIKADPENPASLNSNAIYALYQDRSGIIWVGTFGGGINVYNPRKAKFLTYVPKPHNQNSLSNKSVLAFLEDTKGNIWIGTDGGGLNRFDRKTNTFEHFRHNPNDPSSLSSDVVKAIYEDRDGNLWIGTYLGGLNLFDPAKGEFQRLGPDSGHSPVNSIIWRIYEDSRGNLWLSTLGNGMSIYNRATKSFRHFQPYEHDGALGDYNVISMHEDQQGVLWILTEDQGINIYNYETDRFSYIKHNPGDSTSLSNNHTWVIFEDSKDDLWIGTGGGGLNLYQRKTKSFKRYTVRDGLPSNIVTNILEDKAGYLWITTSKGLTRFDPRQGTCKNFDATDGLQSNDFNINAALVSTSGELYVGGLKGFNIFSPDRLQDNAYVPPVVITGFQIFNKPVEIRGDGFLQKQISETEKIVLSYKESVLTLRFAALNFTSSEKNQYAYRMMGFESTWNYGGTKREVTYTNLDAGTYTFQVKASNNDGLWNEEMTTLHVIITPPWWETLWFRSLVSAFLITLAITIYKIRTRAIRNAMRQEKMQELTLQEAKMREERLKHEKAVIELSKSKLESDVAFKNSELATSVMSVVKQNESLLKIKEDIAHALKEENKEILSRHLKKIMKVIDQEVKPDQSWDQFELLFNQIHENFLQKLKERFPDLTSRDLKLCAYLRMNLNSKEIAPLLSLSVRGVEDLRYRVRKKMGLDTTVNLADFVLSL